MRVTKGHLAFGGLMTAFACGVLAIFERVVEGYWEPRPLLFAPVLFAAFVAAYEVGGAQDRDRDP